MVERASLYVKRLNSALTAHETEQSKLCEHDKTVAKEKQQKEYEHNFQRFQQGLGGVGERVPLNVTIDIEVEEPLLRMMTESQQRRYYFGSDTTAPTGVTPGEGI